MVALGIPGVATVAKYTTEATLFFFEIAHFFSEDSVRPGESPSRLLPPSPIDHHRMRSTFAWREPDVGRRLATVRRTYSWELPRAPVSPDERSRQITGPYLDAAGKDMELGGGTLVIGAKDAHGNSASGHAGVLELRHASNRSDRRLVLSSHYYLAHGDGRGLSFLQWHELEYDAAGWPRLGARHVPKLRL